jgi:hypothetical protein
MRRRDREEARGAAPLEETRCGRPIIKTPFHCADRSRRVSSLLNTHQLLDSVYSVLKPSLMASRFYSTDCPDGFLLFSAISTVSPSTSSSDIPRAGTGSPFGPSAWTASSSDFFSGSSFIDVNSNFSFLRSFKISRDDRTEKNPGHLPNGFSTFNCPMPRSCALISKKLQHLRIKTR